LPPIEIIDGQHRLWAFDGSADDELSGDFELPVVAFHGLDVGWQAYLFWSVNVSPKRINPSHAFDLYPLLRSQEWLEKYSDLTVYREARAQELTEVMFRHSQSPWFERINMLGEPGRGGVSQAGWIRSLTSSLLGPGGRGRAARGLFGTNINAALGPLPWSRAQQAAFLIDFWTRLRGSVTEAPEEWVAKLLGLQAHEDVGERSIAAFEGKQTMLNQEQGVRGVLSVLNEICFEYAKTDRSLFQWKLFFDEETEISDEDVTLAMASLAEQPFASFSQSIADGMAKFDWRSSDAPNLNDDERLIKRAFRGSGGYVELRGRLLRTVAADDSPAGQVAEFLLPIDLDLNLDL